MTRPHSRKLISLAIVVLAGLLALAASAQAAAPIKLIPTGRFGRAVNLTQVEAHAGPALEDICTVTSKDQCQEHFAERSPVAGGFSLPLDIAGTPGGDVYVADHLNARVQEFEADGKFVLMFGREVDATTKGDVCTAASRDTCQAGVRGTAPGQLDFPDGVIVDPVSHDVYVDESINGSVGVGQRVQKFTPEGQFLLEIGKEVNETTKHNLCTQEEVVKVGVKCKGPAEHTGVEQAIEPGAFSYAGSAGDLVAVNETGRLYVGGEDRIQEFESDGESVGQITVDGTGVTALAVAPTTGNLYAGYEGGDVVDEFSPAGVKIGELTVAPREPSGHEVGIQGIAIDGAGYLAVNFRENYLLESGLAHTSGSGALYNTSTGRLMTEWHILGEANGQNEDWVEGIGFNGTGQLFGGSNREEVFAYEPVNVAELATTSADCVPGGEQDSSVTLDCGLNGEVNPWGVAGTEVWFQWGRTSALSESTPKQLVCGASCGSASNPSSAQVDSVRPNEASFYYRIAGEDQNVRTPELVHGETLSFTTPIVAPRIVGEPVASFATSSSIVLSTTINPENASTQAFFEYVPVHEAGAEPFGACPQGGPGACPGELSTPVAQSGVYGKTSVVLEATGLQPATTYRYRLFAEDESAHGSEKLQSTGQVGSFTTAPGPVLRAQTEPASAVGTTSAIVSGTVDSDGQAAGYTFELGVYEGANTQYGVLLSGPLAASVGGIGESYQVTGLQPGTTYAYRITLASGYGSATGQTVLFTTAGLPSALVSPVPLALLAVPSIAFPKPVPPAKHKATTNKKTKKKKAKKRAAKKSSTSRRKQYNTKK